MISSPASSPFEPADTRVAWYRRPIAMIMALLIAVAGLGTLPSLPAANAAETSPLEVTKTGPSSAAPGDTVTYRVKIANTGDTTLYNVLLADLLPAGETFQSGSTTVDSPYEFGDPTPYGVTQTSGTPAGTTSTGQTLLVWPNELDLAAGQSLQFEYKVTIDADASTGSTVTNSLQAFANSDPRVIPEIDTTKVTGGGIDQNELASIVTKSSTTSDTAQQQTTISTVTLLKDKSSATADDPASGDSAWLRGVHENKRQVPLTVKNAGASDASYQLIDFLPASFEFLDGTSVSTTSEPEWTAGTDGQSQAEQTGVGTTTTVTADPTSSAATAAVASVETVVATAEDAAAYGVTEGSTYTRIVWNVTIPAQSTLTVKYWAGIPLQENTTDWNGEAEGEGTAPTGTAQASNLDNNTGAYTRDLVGQPRTNVAALTSGGAVVVTDSQTYTIADVVEGKSVVDENGTAVDAPNTRIGQDPAWDYRPGTLTYFNLTTSLSEYVGADGGDGTTSSIVLTDTLPDGMQPVAQSDGDAVDQALDTAFGAGGALSTISDQRYAGTAALVTTTDPTTDPALEMTYDSATFDAATGKWTVTLKPSQAGQDLVRSESVTVRIPVYQQTVYSGTDDSRLGNDVVAYDQFQNSVSATVQTEAGVAEETPGVKERVAGDTADLQAITPTIDKQVLPRESTADFTAEFGAGTLDAADESAFADSTSTAFEQGDLVWFKISFDLADPTLSLRNTQLTDFLPEGSKLYGWTFAEDNTAPTTLSGGGSMWTATGDGSTTVAPGAKTSDEITSTLTWSASQTYQELNDTENRKLSVLVGVELTTADGARDNLAKASVTNTHGAVVTFRDQVAYEVNAAPSMGLTKDVVGISSGDCTAGSAIADGAQVTSGQCVTYEVTATNTGGQAVIDPTIWDVLPAGFTSGTVYSDSALSSSVGATDDSGTLKWTYDGTLAANASVTYWVTATAPATPEVNTTFTNTAGVRDFATELDYDGTDDGTDLDQATWYPKNNIDSSATSNLDTTAKDTATVKSPNVSLTKTVTSGIGDANNNWSNATGNAEGSYGSSAQAVIGEKVTFKITLTVPANTTVTSGSLKDAVGNAASSYPQLAIDPSGITVTKDGTTISTPSFTDSSAKGFTWAQDFSNPTTASVTYVLTVPGTVTGYSPETAGSGKNVSGSAKNTATFTSANNGGIVKTAQVQVINPNLTAVKTATPNSSVGAGQDVTFTLTGTNQGTNSGTATPGLKDAKLVDTLPGGLTYTGVGTVALGGTALSQDQYTVILSNVALNGPTSTDANTPSTVAIQLQPGVVVAAGQALSATLTVQTPDPVTASATYDNALSFEGDSLTDAEATAQEGTAQHYATTTSTQVTVNGAGATKTITGVTPVADGTGLTDANGDVTTATSSGTAKVTPGQTVTYQVTGTIPANTETFDTMLVDTLPAGAEFVSASITDPSGNPVTIGDGSGQAKQIATGQTHGWVIGHVASSAQAQTYTVTVQVRFPAELDGSTNSSVAAGAQLTNTAQTKWNLSDLADPTDPAAALEKSSDPATATVTVVEPSVGVGKQVTKVNGATPSFASGAAEVNPGDTVEYQVTFTNATTNASTAYDFSATDTLPATIDPGTVSITGTVGSTGVAGASASRTDGVIAVGATSIPTGGTITVTYTASLKASAELDPSGDGWTESNTNTAQISHYSSLPKDGAAYSTGTREYTGGSDTAVIEPVFPRVAVAKTPTSGTAVRGSAYQWTVTVTNDGQGVAENVKVVDRLPDDWTFTETTSVTKSTGSTSSALSASSPAVGATGTVTWQSDAAGWTLQPGEKITVVYTATPNDGTTGDATTAAPGDHTNIAGVELTDASGAQTNGEHPGRTDSITEQGESSYAGPDATATARILNADLSVAKTGLAKDAGTSANPIIAGNGEREAWNIVVTNNGPDTATGPFTITDVTELPDGATLSGISDASASAGWSITGTPAKNAEGKWVVTYSYGGASTTLADDASLPTLTVQVTAPADTVIDPVNGATGTDTATVDSATLDDDPSNDSGTDTIDFTTQADLQLTKGVATASADIGTGRALGWTLTVTNNGPSDSVGTGEHPITVTDTVPAGVKDVTVGELPTGWVLASGSKGTAADKAQAGDTITLQFVGTLADDASVTIPLGGTVLAGFLNGEIDNSAEVFPGATVEPSDPGTTNNTGEAKTSITDDNNGTTLSIDKHRVVKNASGEWVAPTDQQTITPGEDVSYLVTVTNQGPADATGITSVDALPEGLTYTSIESVEGTWQYVSTSGQTVSLELSSGTPAGTLTVGSSASYVITASTSSSITTDVENTAYATADNAAEVHDTDTGGPVRSVDLGIEKTYTDPAVTPTAGSDFSYTLTVTNHGPSDTTGPITVTDTLPSVMTYQSSTVSVAGSAAVSGAPTVSATGGNQQVIWTVGDGSTTLAVGQTVIVTVIVHIASDAPAATVQNVATVSGPNTDPVPGNNTSTRDTPITTSTDIGIVKTVDSGPWVAGTDVDYTVTLTVSGPSIARDVTLSDVLPAGLTPVSIGADGDGWTWNQSTATGTRDTLAPGTYTIPITARIDQGVATGTDLVNRATTTWSDTDPSTSNTKSDDETIDITTVGDLAVTKTAVDENGQEITAVTAGTELRYAISVTNNGPSQAVAPITVSDTLPAGITFTGIVSGDGWTVAAGSAAQTPVLVYSGALASGATAPQVVIATHVAADAYVTSTDTTGDTETHQLTNTATVDSATPDTNPTNDTDDATVDVTEQADLSVTKTHDASVVRIGDALPFTITVSNHGPSVARGVIATEALPAGLDYVGLQTPAEGQPSAWQQIGDPIANEDGTTSVTFALTDGDGALLPGATAPELRLDTTVAVGAYPLVTNGVDVASDTPEADIPDGQDDPYPNHADDPVDVPSLATLGVTKTHEGELKIGQKAVYVITVTNSGPTEDTGAVTVTDELPQGLTYRSADQSGVSVSGQTVTWLPDAPIGVGESRTLRLTVSVGEAAGDHVVNTVTVTSDAEQTPDAVLTASDAADVAAADPLARTGLEFSILLSGFLLLVGGAAVTMLRDAGRSRGRRAR